MTFRWALLLGWVVAAGCKSKPSAPPPPPPVTDAGAADDAASAGEPTPDPPEPDEVPDEDALRAGKRTGLGSPDERPEVATEDFAGGLLTAKLPWQRVIDPARGVVELRTMDDDQRPAAAAMGRRCGADLDATLARLGRIASAVLAEAGGPRGYTLACDNSDLAGGVAVCSIDAAGDAALAFDLVFVPDLARGLRLVGVTLLDALPPDNAIQDAFDLELGSVDGRCP